MPPEENCTAGGTARNDTQSEGVLGSRPMRDILYKAPLMANKLHITNVSLDMRIDVRSMGDILGSTNLANAVFTVKADLTGLYIA